MECATVLLSALQSLVQFIVTPPVKDRAMSSVYRDSKLVYLKYKISLKTIMTSHI